MNNPRSVGFMPNILVLFEATDARLSINGNTRLWKMLYNMYFWKRKSKICDETISSQAPNQRLCDVDCVVKQCDNYMDAE